MAHQDYVSRSRAKNKKQNPYKKNEQPPQGLSTKLKLITAFLIIAIPSFSYMLWSIKDKQPETVIEPKVIKAKKKAAELPELPEEKWTYVDDLKSKQVEVGEYEVTQRGPYKMQCGSFRTRKQAESLKAKIAFTGLEAQVSKATGTSSVWYKVYLGPYTKKREAEKDKHKLKNNSVHGCKIWGWD
ncbi:SPOR domain-containing protein [Colwellia sp. 6M3]|uniref:SPOR domain-containing protein n=1 Tax=Colwellia sp. 6M3 TaxID=2759849 RepID=UPI0015F6EF26|nr:SPOR domain-containing protein [Colwellia sp. 6M3]MBA6416086.1 SPOR domain-containing protein [Colwellia sp. 6M3]